MLTQILSHIIVVFFILIGFSPIIIYVLLIVSFCPPVFFSAYSQIPSSLSSTGTAWGFGVCWTPQDINIVGQDENETPIVVVFDLMSLTAGELEDVEKTMQNEGINRNSVGFSRYVENIRLDIVLDFFLAVFMGGRWRYFKRHNTLDAWLPLGQFIVR